MIGHLLTGRYLILKTLGAGGFSETYLARDKYLPHHPLCVVKCLQLSSSSAITLETAQRLFETEARILDQLGQNHGQIPTLFAYCHEQDQVYQVQEYIDGESLRGWVTQSRRLVPQAAIELLLEVLPVLDYIHSQRVIHRDIKPSNLIRRRSDGKIVLIDFGAACFLPETDSNTKPESEDTPLAIGTPGYMPDEQHLGMSQLNSDLYALGILVIQLLTGIHPQQFQQDVISGELNWQTHLPESSIDPNLAAILDQMIRSHPNHRYQEASDVIAALQTLPSTTTVRPSKHWFVSNRRRNLQRMIKPAAMAIALAGLVGSGWMYHSQQTRGSLTGFHLLSPQSKVDLTLLHDLPVAFGIERLLIAPNNRILVAAGSDHALHLWSLADGVSLRTLAGHTDSVVALAVSQDSRLLVSGGNDRTIRLWDMASGKLLQTFEAQAAVTAVAISPEADRIVSGSEDGTIRIWDRQTTALLNTLTISDAKVTALAYGATSSSLISASRDRLQVWNLRTGQLHRTFSGHTAPIVGLQVVDNQTLVSFGNDRALVWDLQREELMQVCSDDSAKPVTASLNSQHMIAVGDDGRIRTWTRKAGRLVRDGTGTLGRNLNVALSPDHLFLVSWNPNHRLQVWQLQGIGNEE